MVNVIGLGYIGLPTSLMLASHGIEVVGTDYNEQLIKRLQSGTVTLKEGGIDVLFDKAVKSGIRFCVDYQTTNVYIISVPTPYDKTTKKIDVHFVVEATKSIIKVCDNDAIIVIESTISPGTIDKYIRPLIEENKSSTHKNLHLVHAPERIIPGNMMFELENNNRTIGADNKEVGEQIKKIYSSFCKGDIILTDIRTAEMSKVVENTYRAVNIAFANELSRLCHYDNMDVNEIIKICNTHPRVNILNPGPGVGGHCIPVDPWFLVGDYPQLTDLISTSMKINEGQPLYVLSRIRDIMKERDITDYSRVGLYGLTYKENVDDYRESPTLQLLEMQDRCLATPLKSYDPYIDKDIVRNQYHDFDTFLKDIDLVVIMVKHYEITSNWDKLAGKTILDCHNICPLEGIYQL